MTAPAALVLGVGIGALMSPLLGIACVFVSDWLAERNYAHEGLAEWARTRGRER